MNHNCKSIRSLSRSIVLVCFALLIVLIQRHSTWAVGPDPEAESLRLWVVERGIDRAQAPVVMFARPVSADKLPDLARVVFAAWDDGLVLFADSLSAEASEWSVGRIDPEKIQSVLAQLRHDGLFERSLTSISAFGSAPEYIYANSAGEVACVAWDGSLPIVDGEDRRVRGFLCTWWNCRVSVQSIWVQRGSGLPLAAVSETKSVRGYAIEFPWRSDWYREVRELAFQAP